MDFNKFVAENAEKYGLTEDDWDPYRKSAVIRFDYDGKNVSGKYLGVVVYRDRSSESVILPGEIWICSLKPNPSGMNYFAKAIQKIDASYLHELRKDQQDEIADILWERNRDILEPMFEERYKQANEERIAKAVEDAGKAFDAERAELQEKVSELETKRGEDERIIASLRASLDAAMKAPRPRSSSKAAAAQAPADAPTASVTRTGPNTIASGVFTFSRCFVHMTFDHKSIKITPDVRGDVICVGGEIALKGLDTISPYAEGAEMPCDMVWGGDITVYLKR